MKRKKNNAIIPGVFTRWWIYSREMFPVAKVLPGSVALFYSLYLLVGALTGKDLPLTGPVPLGGTLTVFFWLLFLRTSDELKDRDTDRVLFPERPLPSGRVLESDIWALWGFSIGGLFILNGTTPGLPFWFFLGLFVYGLLMFKYFFFPQKISKSLILALLTHNPSVFLLNLYILAVATGGGEFHLIHWALAFFAWIPGFVWEISRKIRLPKEEDRYVTYSRIFGFGRAKFLCAALVALHFTGILWLHLHYEILSLLYVAVACGAAMGVLIQVFRFRSGRLTPKGGLKTPVEAYLLVAQGGMAVDLFLSRSGWI